MVYILASNCVITEGHSRCLLTDLQTNRVYAVSKEISSFLSTPIELEKLQDDTTIHLVHSLIDKGILLPIPADDIVMFSPLKTEYDCPSIIFDAIIEYGLNIDVFNVLSQLISLRCKYIEIRFPNLEVDYFRDTIVSILQYIDQSSLESIDLKLPVSLYNKCSDFVFSIEEQHARVANITVFGQGATIEKDSDRIIYSQSDLVPESCGAISELYMLPNLRLYTESLHHNTCLNRKISIDAEGNIKNCPSMKDCYGNIKDTTLKEAIEKQGFKKYWNIKKDDIAVCKDCEFRNICTDCRAYLENPEEMYSKPLKCGYNPYACEWEEWSTNPLKQKAIEYYRMQELVKSNTDKQ